MYSRNNGTRIRLSRVGRIVFNEVVSSFHGRSLPALEVPLPEGAEPPPMELIAALRGGELIIRDGNIEPVVPMPTWTGPFTAPQV